MCFKYLKIKASTPFSPRSQFVPCGQCAECRDMMRSAWSFRLRAELQQRYLEGWKVGFFTLTYNDEHLPHIPIECFNGYDSDTEYMEHSTQITELSSSDDGSVSTFDVVPNGVVYKGVPDYKPIKCFDKEHVRTLVHGIRKWLHRNYGIRKISYCICGEYGPKTQRPHYHGLIAWPTKDGFYEDRLKDGTIRKVPYRGVDGLTIYTLIRDFWCGESNLLDDDSQVRFGKSVQRQNLGFVGPRRFEGYDRGDTHEKPFLVDKVADCANYASKYCCKDLSYIHYLKDVDLNRKHKLLKRHLCFHMQNRSLGLCAISNLNDEQKLDLYCKGFQFLGDSRRSPIPVYIRDKLIFTPLYIIDAKGNRLVRKQCNVFCIKHKDEIYKKKEDYYAKIIERACSADFFTSRSVSADDAAHLAAHNKEIVSRYGSHELASYYLCFYGVPMSSCYFVDAPTQYFNRYYDAFGSPTRLAAPIIPFFIQLQMRRCIGEIFGSIGFSKAKRITKQKKQKEDCKDFHSQKTAGTYAI